MENKISIAKLSWWLKIFVANIFCEKIEIFRIAGPQYIKVFAHDNFISLNVRKEATAPKKIFKKAQAHILEEYLISKIPLIYKSISICENKDSYTITLYFDTETLKNSTYFFNIIYLCNALEKYLFFVFKYEFYHPFMDDWDLEYLPNDVYGISLPPHNFMPSILNGNKLHMFFRKEDYENNLPDDEEKETIMRERENENIHQLKEILFDALPKVYSTFKITPFKTHYEIVITLLKVC
ncbi:MAG: hypothetical protein J6K51_04270 [Clostridia bacterium]|nr:hypothetical protein [Clostridia bacterium]